jgi:ABC-2 type transport system ATP-binding protein
MKSEPIIRVSNIRRSFKSTKKEEGLKGTFKLLLNPEYQEHEALKGVSFDIEEGSFIGLIGANGAGKTTLLKILSGLIPPTSGQAVVIGQDPFKRAMDFRKSISLVMGQKAQLWWDLPAIDAFELLKAIYAVPEKLYRERLDALAELLDVKKLLNTQIRRLSLGERMKMELIGALIHWPKVIFLDEPTIGLDVLAAHKLREFLREFNQREKATIILTSHNMDDIERLCSRVLILKQGELVFDGDPRQLKRSDECRLRLRLMESPSVAEFAAIAHVPEPSVEISGASGGDTPGETKKDEEDSDADGAPSVRVALKRNQIAGVLQSVLAKYTLIDMAIEEQSLEKVIQRLYESET